MAITFAAMYRFAQRAYSRRAVAKGLRGMLLTLPNPGKSVFVFALRGVRTTRSAPLRDIREAMRPACKGASIAFGAKVEGGFLFRNLRRTFQTHARRPGVPRSVIMAIMDHSDDSDMNARYDLIEDPDLLAAVDLIEKVFSESITQSITENGKRMR